MRDTFLPLATPVISDAAIREVEAVLRSGWLTTGPRVKAFEAKFGDVVGLSGGQAVAVSSGTAGMHLVLRALDIGPDDEVITPSLTWVSTVNIISMLGATPVWADVDRDTLMVRPETIGALIGPRTRAIVPVHFAGAPCEVDAIEAIGAAHGMPVVWDAAHALGTRIAGTPIGAQGTNVFSFHPTKAITTGEGGMVTSTDDGLLERVRRLRFHGLGVDAYDRRAQGRSPHAEVIEPGLKYNLTDIAAAIGLHQLDGLEDFIARRAVLAARYRERLAGMDGIEPLANTSQVNRHAWHLYVVRVTRGPAQAGRDRFISALRERNIGSGIHFRAVHAQPYYRGVASGVVDLPNTDWNSDRLVSLPLCPSMTLRDVDDVVDAISEILA